MYPLPAKNELIDQLQKEIRSLQGFRRTLGQHKLPTGIPALEKAFPDQTFPTGAVHEFISPGAETAAATCGFMTGLLGRLMQQGGVCLWISTRRTLYPPALKLFGIAPERIIFIDLPRQKEALWTIEEALKCEALAAVVGEVSELSFKESRRLQLAVEESRVTGFIHRVQPRSENTVACVTRWKISPLASQPEAGMPGLGFPRWNVNLAKVRNGRPGSWQIEWAAGGFQLVAAPAIAVPGITKRKAG